MVKDLQNQTEVYQALNSLQEKPDEMMFHDNMTSFKNYVAIQNYGLILIQ